MLLISNKNAPTKTYQFDGWNFVETTIQFTGGSFGTGVSKMRTHKLNDEFLVIGNKYIHVAVYLKERKNKNDCLFLQ